MILRAPGSKLRAIHGSRYFSSAFRGVSFAVRGISAILGAVIFCAMAALVIYIMVQFARVLL